MTKLSLRLCILLMVTLGLNACGFKLRSAQPLPNGIEQVYLSGAQQYSPLKRAVKEYFDIYQIPYVDNIPVAQKDSTIAIFLYPDTLERRLLSLFNTGQVAEYELVLTIRFQVIFPGKEAQMVEFDVTREYQDDPDAILAKSRELELVLKELRKQAADRIVRMLPSLDDREV
ncbi:LPS-assembly lipoprotein LptE [Aliiglaciecola lipolytica]|uniref:LPS-assembly lipoprotein LptE n=1 Tax=Aliiglaciecola lipolytica E3 TaxID=1127673 RepID=K6X2Q6_9ALTE|nr:LPS assembly lipoprotein LptE [Aliiglaciecola lipolytica]GAC14919.1 LPS-assembly lipoprotein [Aliiglaciecola lipolytica E3]